MAKLKPWYQVVTTRGDLRENRPEATVWLEELRRNVPADDQDSRTGTV